MTEYDLRQNVERNAELEVAEKQRSIKAANQNSAIARIVNIVYFLFGILELLLALRVVLHAVGANPDNGFANFIYAITWPFVALFSNLFTNPALSSTAVLELTTVVSMIVWAIVAWLVGRAMWLALSRPR